MTKGKNEMKYIAITLLLLTAPNIMAAPEPELPEPDFRQTMTGVKLMEICKTDIAHCEFIAEIALHNSLLSFELGVGNEPDAHKNLALTLSLPSHYCLELVTPTQIRKNINENYGNQGVANHGAGHMLFNAINAEAYSACQTVSEKE
jgi:hypothetical protein